MAFSHSKTEIARKAAASHLEKTLYDFLDGRERPYAVRWAMREVTALFGPGAVLPAELVAHALACPPDDESRRLSLVIKALDLITAQLGGDRLPL